LDAFPSRHALPQPGFTELRDLVGIGLAPCHYPAGGPALTIARLTGAAPRGGQRERINAIPVVAYSSDGLKDARVVIPTLDAVLTAHDAGAAHIITSLQRSLGWDFVHAPRRTGWPAHWRTVTYQGLTIGTPPSWQVQRIGYYPGDALGQDFPAVLRGTADSVSGGTAGVFDAIPTTTTASPSTSRSWPTVPPRSSTFQAECTARSNLPSVPTRSTLAASSLRSGNCSRTRTQGRDTPDFPEPSPRTLAGAPGQAGHVLTMIETIWADPNSAERGFRIALRRPNTNSHLGKKTSATYRHAHRYRACRPAGMSRVSEHRRDGLLGDGADVGNAVDTCPSHFCSSSTRHAFKGIPYRQERFGTQHPDGSRRGLGYSPPESGALPAGLVSAVHDRMIDPPTRIAWVFRQRITPLHVKGLLDGLKQVKALDYAELLILTVSEDRAVQLPVGAWRLPDGEVVNGGPTFTLDICRPWGSYS
jgi:hypothetical protein